MENFPQIASRFARNPLGIIALFIVLAYAIGGGVFTAVIQILDVTQVYFFLIFIVLFPIVIILIFYRLVTHHHTKLYAPADFRGDEAYLTAVGALPGTSEEKKAKLIQEERENVPDDSGTQTPQGAAEDSRATQKRRQIFEAESLALQEFETEIRTRFQNVFFRRNVKFIRDNKTTIFDAVADTNKGMYLVEVNSSHLLRICPT